MGSRLEYPSNLLPLLACAGKGEPFTRGYSGTEGEGCLLRVPAPRFMITAARKPRCWDARRTAPLQTRDRMPCMPADMPVELLRSARLPVDAPTPHINVDPIRQNVACGRWWFLAVEMAWHGIAWHVCTA